ncbi:MAG: addiction module protein [Ktedonobacteraceae bacterium]
MTEQTRILLEQARRLSAIDRAALVDELLSSLDQPDEAVQAQWEVEAERRLAAYDRGEIQAIDVDEAFSRLHKKQT